VADVYNENGGSSSFSLEIHAIPEPDTAVLMATGLGLFASRPRMTLVR